VLTPVEVAGMVALAGIGALTWVEATLKVQRRHEDHTLAELVNGLGRRITVLEDQVRSAGGTTSATNAEAEW
jgi:hypothetical protein